MADPIQTNVQVQDIPEYLRDYRSALLNAAFQSVFSKPHLKDNFPRATWYSAGSPAASTGAGSTQAGGTTSTDTQTPEEGTAKSESNKIANALAMVSGQMPKLLGMVWDPKTRTYVPEAYKGITSGSGATLEDIVEAYENLRKSMPVGALPDIYEKETLTGGVTYPGSTNPFGVSSDPAATSSYTTGTGFSTTLGKYNPAPNISTGTPVTIGTRIPGTGPIDGNTGGSGSTGSGSGGSTGSTGAPPIGTPESSVVIPSYSSGSAGTTPENRGAGGYNPDQYATDQRATGLASLLGGNVASTRSVGPIAPPSQNLIDFGDGAQLNAGLVDRALGNITVDGVSRARTSSEMTQSLAGLRDEISAGGGDTSQIDRLIQQNNRAYSSGATVSPVGQPAQPPASGNRPAPRGRGSSLNTGATGSNPSSQVSAPPEYQYSSGRSAGSQSSRGSASGSEKPSLTEYQGTPVPGKSTQADDSEESQPSFGYDRFAQTDPGGFWAALRNAKPEPRSNRDDDEYGMAGGGLARFEIGDDGKVRNYSRGGALRRFFGGGFGMPMAGGFGGGYSQMMTPSVMPNSNPMSQSMLQPASQPPTGFNDSGGNSGRMFSAQPQQSPMQQSAVFSPVSQSPDPMPGGSRSPVSSPVPDFDRSKFKAIQEENERIVNSRPAGWTPPSMFGDKTPEEIENIKADARQRVTAGMSPQDIAELRNTTNYGHSLSSPAQFNQPSYGMQQPGGMYGGMPQPGGMQQPGGMYGGMPQFGGMHGGMPQFGGMMYGGMPQFRGGMYGGMPQFSGGMYGGMPQLGGGMYGGMPQFGGMYGGGMYGGMPQFGGMYGGGMGGTGHGPQMLGGIGGFLPQLSPDSMMLSTQGLGQSAPQSFNGARPQGMPSPYLRRRAMGMAEGGAVRKVDGGGFTGPNLGGFGATHTPSSGGFGGSGGLAGFWNAANPDNQLGTSIFNPPPVYGGQRLPMFTEDFGQGNAKDGFTSSRMTNQALYHAGRLPSIFTEVQDKKTGDWSTQLSSAGDFGKGVGNINFATDIAGEAADIGRDFLGKTMSSPDQQSYLMSLMPGIKEMGFKGPIKIDPLKAPTLQAPTGVTAAGLKDYQLEQPLGVSGENIDILGRLGGLNAAQVQGVPQVQQFQMQGPERVTGQTRDILSVLGDVSGSKVEGVPQVQQFQMGPAERVGAERTSVDAFGRPQAEQYISPYMDAVTDVQKQEASRQAAMQKAGRSAAAVRAGAFGGSRQAIQEGMAEEALQRQIGDIEATGRQRAFENAQAQFERDRAASLASQQANVQSGLQAALANQQAGVTTGRENLGASLATQQLGTQAGLQAALANQQAAQQAGLTKYGTRADILKSQSAQDLQAALANQQAGLMAGRENLGAQLATQQLGTQTGLQAALANQQAQQQAGLTQYGATADVLRGQSAQNLQADLANQQAGLAAGRENLAARLGTQQLGAQQALQAQLANQQAGLTAGQGNLQSALATQQLATQSGLEAAKASQSGDLATWQMQLDVAKQASAEQEAARQRGFQNRLAAMQQAQAGAAGLAGLGSTMMGIPGMAQQLELQRLAAMQQAGGAVDARTQQAMDMAYQDYINQQNFPYQQMNFLQGIMSGVPVGMQVEGVQFQRPSSGGLSGLATAGAGLFSNYLQQGR